MSTLASLSSAPLVTSAATAASRPFASPDVAGAAAPAGLTGLTQVTLALALVVAAIFALAWLVRRLRGLSGESSAALAVLAEVRLGPKERAVLVRAGSAQLLLGVAPGSVQALHVLAEPVAASPSVTPAAQRPSFRALLMRSLGKP
ncbi:MAG TPA: flagellar biosynthetic protein FliO [Steroidobacteraceae bacterium]|nr:flagellar biosynthetic protein FliO [Steroidobacteraceae bacterium]